MMGSAGYTAPERFSGQDATPASDPWSLGAILYAAVEGHGPCQRESMSSILAEILRRMHDETAPESLVAANWLDPTPADSALTEIAKPAEWAEWGLYDPPPPPPQPQARTTTIGRGPYSRR